MHPFSTFDPLATLLRRGGRELGRRAAAAVAAARCPGPPGDDPDRTRAQLAAYAADVRRSYAQTIVRRRQLDESYIATVRSLATAVEAKDDDTGNHIQRVHDLGLLLAGAYTPDQRDDPQLAYGFLLHDIGKLSVPDAVLTKPAALDDDEWALMRRHPREGVRILSSIPFLDRALDVVLHHHERWDGGGYPDRLAGEDIPPWARLFAVVDTVDAIMSDRPYRAGRPLAVARAILQEESGRQFDPACVAAFAALDDRDILAVWGRHAQRSSLAA